MLLLCILYRSAVPIAQLKNKFLCQPPIHSLASNKRYSATKHQPTPYANRHDKITPAHLLSQYIHVRLDSTRKTAFWKIKGEEVVKKHLQRWPQNTFGRNTAHRLRSIFEIFIDKILATYNTNRKGVAVSGLKKKYKRILIGRRILFRPGSHGFFTVLKAPVTKLSLWLKNPLMVTKLFRNKGAYLTPASAYKGLPLLLRTNYFSCSDAIL